MKVRPKNIVYAAKGVKFSLGNEKGKNWKRDIFNKYKHLILEKLQKYGNADDYGLWLNEMLSRHAKLYKAAGGKDNNWEEESYYDPSGEVYRYLTDYRGEKGNNSFSRLVGPQVISYDVPNNKKMNIYEEDALDFNLYGIKPNLETRYVIDGIRNSGDYSRIGSNYDPDNLYSAITDDRRLLGRAGDWDNPGELEEWNNELSKVGWKMELDPTDGYYKLKRFTTKSYLGNTTPLKPYNPQKESLKDTEEVEGVKEDIDTSDDGSSDTDIDEEDYTKKPMWQNLRLGFEKLLNNPDFYSNLRFISDLGFNAKIYDEALKGIRPILKQSYHTHRQVVGDEATKQAYYRRAAQGLTQAAQPFTSDADRQTAYQMEARRAGDALRALGDLANNQEIRRTSAESSQHEDANAERDNLVANYNIESLIKALAAKQNLKALKYSALGSSVDNKLKEMEDRAAKKKARFEAINDEIFTLKETEAIESDPDYIDAKNAYNKVVKENTDPTTGILTETEEVRNAKKNLLQSKRKAMERSLDRRRRYLQGENIYNIYAKSGTKITRKLKDDLLYKSARDVVKHFLQMSKLSSNALNRKGPKIEKLASHPKGSTKKYLYGGVAPFLVYTPSVHGGETTTSSESSTSGTKGKSSEKLLEQDLLKKLFESLISANGIGLPSDTNSIFSSIRNLMLLQEAFGDTLTTDEILSLYLLEALKLNLLRFNKSEYENARTIAKENESLGDYAIDDEGRVAFLDAESGKVFFKKYSDVDEEDIGKKYIPITNGNLLKLRAYSNDLAFNSKITLIISDGIGLSKIEDYLNTQISKIGIDESQIEGYSKNTSNVIKNGLRLLKEAPEGSYKWSQLTKELKLSEVKALEFLIRTLPPRMRTILAANAEMLGISLGEMLQITLNSQGNITDKFSLSSPNGDGDSTSSTGSKSLDKIANNPLMAYLRGVGGFDRNYSIITRDSKVGMSVDGKLYPQLANVQEDMSIDLMLKLSRIKSINPGGITLGDIPILGEDLKHIMFSSSSDGVMFVPLPCKIVNKTKQVNFDVIPAYERARQKALKASSDVNSKEYANALGKALHEEKLDSLLDSNGMPNPDMFGVFLVTDVYTTDKLSVSSELDKSQYVERIDNPTDELEQRMSKALSLDKKKSDYSVDTRNHWYEMFWGYNDIYRATIFIPIGLNLEAAALGWGTNTTILLSNDLEGLYQRLDKMLQFNSDNNFE